jgi:lipopolysaccharide/colanic/teichoic acid biosynthesis glycosyltransferase
MVLVRLSDRPLTGWRWVIKDLQDRTLALLLLIFVAPVMIGVALAIKVSDPGPVFFRQKRRGYGSETFDIIKFRSMRIAGNPATANDLRLTVRNDPRVSPIGRFLRKTSLDELPQLLNVLKGDMWIVGPRPHSPLARAEGRIYAEVVQEYLARYRIKPGITGWAQVCGWRGPTDTVEQLTRRVEHDLYYIENWSALFDLKILCKTVTCLFGHDNAF